MSSDTAGAESAERSDGGTKWPVAGPKLVGGQFDDLPDVRRFDSLTIGGERSGDSGCAGGELVRDSSPTGGLGGEECGGGG